MFKLYLLQSRPLLSPPLPPNVTYRIRLITGFLLTQATLLVMWSRSSISFRSTWDHPQFYRVLIAGSLFYYVVSFVYCCFTVGLLFLALVSSVLLSYVFECSYDTIRPLFLHPSTALISFAPLFFHPSTVMNNQIHVIIVTADVKRATTNLSF